MKIEWIRGDITQLDTEAIVNAANSSLLGGGGVDGAIHRKGGPAILEACRQIRQRQGGCRTGEAVITTAGNLPSQYVIHTVGPVWSAGTGNEAQLLRNCYLNALRLAEENGIQSIAFPNISTGIYGYPKEKAAAIAIQAVRDFEKEHQQISRVVFVCFDEENFRWYEELLAGKA